MTTKATKVFQFKASSLSESGEFTALLSPYGPPADAYGDIVERGAYAEDIRLNGPRRVLLSGHDPQKSTGWIDLDDRVDGLYVRGKLFIDELPTAREDYNRLKLGLITAMSIGFYLKDSYMDRDGNRRLTNITLMEGSLVVWPAASRARVTGVKETADEEAALQLLARQVRSMRRDMESSVAPLAPLVLAARKADVISARLSALLARL